MVFSSDALREKAQQFGFNLVGIVEAVPSPTLNAYLRWIEAGMQGTMTYMARPDRQARRRDLNIILPGVRSMVVAGLDFHTAGIPADMLSDPARGRIAAYAWGSDYHNIMTPRLEMLAQWLQASRGAAACRVYVDTGAVLERSHAQQAGLGFVGKNTMLIHPRRGSSFFLGEILTQLDFDSYDQPQRATMCGRCTRCLAGCPTDAFPEPYVLDARRCISYLTIEHKGWIERDLRPLMGNWVFGCDVCQEVCPFQRFAVPTHERAFFPVSAERAAPHLLDLLRLDEAQFKAQFFGSPVIRIGHNRMQRNACVAAGNWGSLEAVPLLKRLLRDAVPLVRGHAAWALQRILGDDAAALLKAHFARETDAAVRDEITALI